MTKIPMNSFKALRELKKKGTAFRLAAAGEQQQAVLKCFSSAAEEFREEIVHWGYLESREEYISLLWQADILPVTSNQEFFGISMLEAVYCGCIPILPNRLAYPEHFPSELGQGCLYDGFDDLLKKLELALISVNSELSTKCARCSFSLRMEHDVRSL